MKFALSARAEADLLAIHSYYFERSPAAADRIVTRLFQRFDELCEFPFLGPPRSDLRPGLRGIVIDDYMALYMVEPHQIAIVRVLDSRMNIEREFLK